MDLDKSCCSRRDRGTALNAFRRTVIVDPNFAAGCDIVPPVPNPHCCRVGWINCLERKIRKEEMRIKKFEGADRRVQVNGLGSLLVCCRRPLGVSYLPSC